MSPTFIKPIITRREKISKNKVIEPYALEDLTDFKAQCPPTCFMARLLLWLDIGSTIEPNPKERRALFDNTTCEQTDGKEHRFIALFPLLKSVFFFVRRY